MFTNFPRRQFLSLLRVVGVGTVATASVPIIGNLFASKAQAQNIYEFVYKGRECRILTNQKHGLAASTDNMFDNSQQLFIDGIEIKIARNKQEEKYMTPLLFGTYNSPQEMAKTLIDLKIKFPSGNVQIDPEVD